MLLYKDNIRPPGNTRVSSASNDNVREPRFVDAAKRARGSRQGMDTISRIRNSCTGVPLSSEPKRTPKPVRANLSALEAQDGNCGRRSEFGRKRSWHQRLRFERDLVFARGP